MSRAQNIQRAQGQLGSQVHCLEKGDGGETIRPLSLSLSHTHTHTHHACTQIRFWKICPQGYSPTVTG